MDNIGFAKSIKKKNTLHNKFLKCPSVVNESKLKKYKNKLTSLLRTSKKCIILTAQKFQNIVRKKSGKF